MRGFGRREQGGKRLDPRDDVGRLRLDALTSLPTGMSHVCRFVPRRFVPGRSMSRFPGFALVLAYRVSSDLGWLIGPANVAAAVGNA